VSATPGPQIAGFAEALATAERDRIPIAPFAVSEAGLDADDAYAIQQLIVQRRIDTGESIVGWKVGLTSRAMQEQLGVDQPDYAPILSGWLQQGGDEIPRDAFIQPRVEAEIAFHLAQPLRGPGVTVDEVLAATAAVSPAIELIDSRIEGWQIRLADTIADQASSARVIVGTARLPVSAVDLPNVAVSFKRNGETVATGTSAAVLGDPAAAVAWAANTLGRLGVTLEAGHLVMPGAMHASVPVTAGDRFTARFDGLGEVSVSFSGAPAAVVAS
jgi:2-keto-4-pentenoate hydratase